MRVFLGKMVIIEFNCHFNREIIRFFIENFTNVFLNPSSSNVSTLCCCWGGFGMNPNMKTTHGDIFMLHFYSV